MKLKTILFSLFCIYQMNAQENFRAAPAPKVADSYNFSQFIGTYIEITGGTVVGNASSDNEVFVDPGNLAGTTVDLSQGVGFPIGFNFTFNGDLFDRVAVCTNGWISLGKSSLGTTAVIGQVAPSPLSQFADGPDSGPKSDFDPNDELRYRIAGLGCNLVSLPTSAIRIETIGTAPNRVLVVQWKNFRPTGLSDFTDHSYNFQIRLVETTNRIEVVYGNMVFGVNGLSAQVGLGGLDQTDYHNRWITSQTGSTNSWLASDAGFVNTSGCDLTSNIAAPASGTTFRWTSTSLVRNDYTFKELNLYPNEVQNILKISNNKQISSVQVYDMAGKQLKNELVNDFTAAINLDTLSAGSYFVKVFSENQSKTVKIIKK